MARQNLVNSSLDDHFQIEARTIRDALEAAIAKQNQKAASVSRKGRMQYAIKALNELALELGVWEVETTAAPAASESLTDQQKAQRIVERNKARGWRTSREVQLVADGESETFEAAKQQAAAEREAAKADKATKPVKRAAKKAPKKSAKALTTTRAE